MSSDRHWQLVGSLTDNTRVAVCREPPEWSGAPIERERRRGQWSKTEASSSLPLEVAHCEQEVVPHKSGLIWGGGPELICAPRQILPTSAVIPRGCQPPHRVRVELRECRTRAPLMVHCSDDGANAGRLGATSRRRPSRSRPAPCSRIDGLECPRTPRRGHRIGH